MNASVQRNEDDQRHVQPVDVLPPIRLRDGEFGDVYFLWIVFGVSVWFVLGRHGSRLRDELWLDSQVRPDLLMRRHLE